MSGERRLTCSMFDLISIAPWYDQDSIFVIVKEVELVNENGNGMEC